MKILDDENNVEVKLIKSLGNKTMEIRFDAQESSGMKEMMQEYIEKSDPKVKATISPEEAQEDMPHIDFSVVVKNSKGNGLYFDCSATQGQLQVFKMMFLKNVESIFSPGVGDFTKFPYPGPSFLSLDDKLQQEVKNYLISLGLTKPILDYITKKGQIKDQKLHVNWLGKMKSFLKDPTSAP